MDRYNKITGINFFSPVAVLVFMGFVLAIAWAVNAYAIDVTGNIATDTTWTIDNSPYVLTGNVQIQSGATLTIDPGVEVHSNGNYYIHVAGGGNMVVNGTAGNMVTFRHATATTPNSWGGLYVAQSGNLTINYANIKHASTGIKSERGTLSVSDSLIENNHVGIEVFGYQASVTTARNTFNSNSYLPIVINPDVGTVSLGQGVDADILGSGATKNGYNAIGMSYSRTVEYDCPSDICTIPQRTFAGIANIPYLFWNSFELQYDTLSIDPGVIIKFRGSLLRFTNNAKMTINGTVGNEAIFTSHKDDTYGGDTNNDGTTIPARGDWGGFVFSTSKTFTINGAKILYANAIESNSYGYINATDSLLSDISTPFRLDSYSSLTTARNTFQNIYDVPIYMTPNSVFNPGQGADADIFGSNIPIKAIGLLPNSSCPAGTCTLSSKIFAGITNIPYYIPGELWWTNHMYKFNPGLIIKFKVNGSIVLNANASVQLNGDITDNIYLTSIKDDSIGGDTNSDGTATTPLKGDYRGFDCRGGGSADIKFTNITYAGSSIYGQINSVSITDSNFNQVNYAVYIENHISTLSTARNTFSNLTVTPIAISPSVTYTTGTGADVDILGSNIGIRAITLLGSNTCPAGGCTVKQLNFAGISNIPYLMPGEIWWWTHLYKVDPGVIIKFNVGASLNFSNNASLQLNGTSSNNIYITSIRDDSIGGDTNNDGNATAPQKANYHGIVGRGPFSADIKYTRFTYGNRVISGQINNVQIVDSYMSDFHNVIYIDSTLGTLLTSRNTFENITGVVVAMPPSVVYTPGIDANKDILGSNIGIDAIQLFTTSNCPAGGCIIKSLNFAGISNIPYYVAGSPWWQNNHVYVFDPGVIIKYSPGSYVTINNNARISINGNNENRVYFTSIHDDTIGGDTNKNGSDTVPAIVDTKFFIINSGANQIDFAEFRYSTTALTPRGSSSLVMNDSVFRHCNYAIYNESSVSPVLARNNFLDQTGLFNNVATYFNAENQYWGTSTGPQDSSNDGACPINNGTGGTVNDNATRTIDYCPFSTKEFNVAAIPTTSIVSGVSNIYAGLSKEIVVDYIDDNGASDLKNMYLSITNPSGTTISFVADNGSNGIDLLPVNITGGEYVTNITYDRYYEYNDTYTTRIVWKFTSIGWNWTESNDVEYSVRAVDVGDQDSGWISTDNNYIYENDLDFYGTLSATGQYQGSLSSGDYVRGGESITWSGVKVVYEGTTDVYPPDDSFNVILTDDDTGSWNDTTSSGRDISIVSVADNLTDTEDIHTLAITDIPTGGSAIRSLIYTIRVDGDTPDIVEVTGNSNNVWQATDGGPVISWTNPNSPSGDTYYITNDGSEPTSSNYHYMTTNNSYDLPDQGIGMTTIKVIARNGVGIYSQIRTFTIKYDNSSPDIVDIIGENEGVWQNTNPGPVISWTDPNSPSDDTFYITIDGSEPTIANYEYSTIETSYDLPDMDTGITTIKVRPASGIGTYGLTRSFVLKYDPTIPDIVDIVGEYDGEWQNVDPGPEVSWTNPNSPSGDTFYITIDGTEPTSVNYQYTTTSTGYDLPDLGQGETVVRVRPRNGAGTYGIAYSFVVRFDSIPPTNVSNLSIQVLSTSSLKLDWTNPVNSDFAKVKILRKLGSLPLSENDGSLVYEGTLSSFTDTNLAEDTKYYYSVFAIDNLGNISSGAGTSATTLKTPTSGQTGSGGTGTTPPPSTGTTTPPAPETQPVISDEMYEEVANEIDRSKPLEIPKEKSLVTLIFDNMTLDIFAGDKIHFFPQSEVTLKIEKSKLMKDATAELDKVLLLVENDTYIMKYTPEEDTYEASFSVGEMKGDFEAKILAIYMDDTTKTLTLGYSVDPYGYIYTTNNQGEQRINGARIELWTNSTSPQLWESNDNEKYPNPQITKMNGEYMFLVEPGSYQLKVFADGYNDYESEWFEVTNRIIQMNIKLEKEKNYLVPIVLVIGILAVGLSGYYVISKKKTV